MGRLFTVEETKEIFRISRSTLYRWVMERRIPYIKVGGRLLFKPNEIDGLLKEKSIRAISNESAR
ncbi:MAG: helix-turn-helix domain-containing protein [Candidatus Hodarchaeota archaeon]